MVELLLDLAGYLPERNLVDSLAVEPAAGNGSFLVQIARRLMDSCRRQGRPNLDCLGSLIAFEIDEVSADAARRALVDLLEGQDVPTDEAQELATSWVRTSDYLIESFALPEADFVVGNPPYVRLEDIPGDVAGLYRDAFPTMRGRADLYVAFFEAALRQLRPGGACAFICADRWFLNQYGGELRRFITGRFGVEAVVEMHNADAFVEEVSAYPAITLIRRADQGNVVVASLGPTAVPPDGRAVASTLLAASRGQETPPLAGLRIAVVDRWFTGSDPWPCGNPDRLALLRRLEERFGPLESAETGTRVGIGVATGCDQVFITKDGQSVEESRLLPLAVANDTSSGHLRWSGHYLVDPWDRDGLVDLERFPRFRDYVERHRDVLRRRHTAKKNPSGWYRTIDRVTHSLATTRKLYIPDIKDQLNPVLDPGSSYPHHNLYFIVSDLWDLEVLGGLLLSAVGQFFVECYGVRMRGGYLRFQAQYLRRIRVPDPRSISSDEATRLIKAFRGRDRKAATSIAAQVYGIDPNELEATLGR